MKNTIERNYAIKVEKITQEADDYKVENRNNTYLFKSINKYDLDLIGLNISDRSRYKIINTRIGNYYIRIKDKNYIMIELDKRSEINVDEIIKKELELYTLENDWALLWQKKNDYIESILEDNDKEYILETKDYYLGLAEEAIVIYKNINTTNKAKYICHKRIKDNIFRMPNNVIIDYKERDIGEYIKYLIFAKKTDIGKIKDTIEIIIKYGYNTELIKARVVYPTEYFDLIDIYRLHNVDINNEISNLLDRENIRLEVIKYINKKRDKSLN